MVKFLKKYLLNIKCILLLLAVLLPALVLMFPSEIIRMISFDFGASYSSFIFPALYLVPVVLVAVFSVNAGHCIALNAIQLISFCLMLFVFGDTTGFSNHMITIYLIGLFVFGVLAAVHVIAIVLRIAIGYAVGKSGSDSKQKDSKPAGEAAREKENTK